MDIRNRITGHHRVKASTLKAHPHNPRNHPDEQRSVLRQLLAEVGFARSVLAYIAAADRALGDDAPLTLIEGHLRQEELGDTEVEVEILDVNDEEAATLLMAIDPLAALADYDAPTLVTLQEATRSDAVRNLWQHVESASACTKKTLEMQTQGRSIGSNCSLLPGDGQVSDGGIDLQAHEGDALSGVDGQTL